MRPELVAFGDPYEIAVDENGVVGGGKHLKPYEVNKLVEARGEEVVFFDGRNAFEAKIGKFKGAVVPDVGTSRDFIKEIESGKYDDLKDKPGVTAELGKTGPTAPACAPITGKASAQTMTSKRRFITYPT